MTEFEHSAESRLGRRMLWLAALALLGGFYFLFDMLDKGGNAIHTVDRNGAAMVIIEQNRDGHYQVDGQINGHDVTFMVDTGATDVAVPVSTARALGLEFGPPVTVMTAAGRNRAWLTRLDEVAIGGIRRHNVRAMIAAGNFNGILLGMSFLKHYDLQQKAGKLVIRDGPGEG